MPGFGLQFLAPRADWRVPRNYAPAQIHLGDFSELVFCNQSLWRRRGYLRHWQETAQRALDGESQLLFCTDRARPTSTVWPGVRQGDDIVFCECIVRTSDLVFDASRVLPREGAAFFADHFEGEASRWRVPLSLIRDSMESLS